MEGQLLEGYIASAPDAGTVDVIVISFDAFQTFNECAFLTVAGNVPAEGARCLLAFDDNGGAWVISWEG